LVPFPEQDVGHEAGERDRIGAARDSNDGAARRGKQTQQGGGAEFPWELPALGEGVENRHKGPGHLDGLVNNRHVPVAPCAMNLVLR
jgi:hypothetical protein